MSDILKRLDRQAQVAQSLANTNGVPYIVVYDAGYVDVVKASEYQAKEHGAAERVRYPDGYRHPSGNRTRGRTW